jgi:hypothetical protein
MYTLDSAELFILLLLSQLSSVSVTVQFESRAPVYTGAFLFNRYLLFNDIDIKRSHRNQFVLFN